MSPDTLGVLLFDALSGLASASHALRQAAQQQYVPRLERLQHAAESIGLTTIARPPPSSEAYIQNWHQYLVDPQQHLTSRALRYLCWEPDIATTNHFLSYLNKDVSALSARMLQGLVHSCHARWSFSFASGAAVYWIKRRLETYRGPHRVLTHWRQQAEMLLGPQGHCLFANTLLAAPMPVKQHCEAWALEESSPYVLEAMRHAVHLCLEHLGREQAWQTRLLTTFLPWVGWPLQDFYMAIGAAMLHDATARELKLQETLMQLVLQDARLGDPRLPRNMKNWLSLQAARQRLLQWLSRADITFFFEHVLPNGTDPHGRKTFWLRYVSRVLMSRPLLNRDDATRLRLTMSSQQGHMEHLGHIRGREPSAFLLDFGNVVVVEFSRVGNACYLYEKPQAGNLIPDFWTQEAFSVSRLKSRLLAAETIVHSGSWQTNLAQILARYGIRPG